MCGQGQKAEKPRQPIFPGHRLPQRKDPGHGVPGGPFRHHLRLHGVRGPDPGKLSHQAPHAPVQHPAEGRQGLSLCAAGRRRGLPPLLPGGKDR